MKALWHSDSLPRFELTTRTHHPKVAKSTKPNLSIWTGDGGRKAQWQCVRCLLNVIGYIALDSLHSQTQVDMKLPRAISTYKSTYCNIRNDSWHTPRSSDLHVLDLNVPTIIGAFLQIPPHLKCHLPCFNPKVSQDVLMSAYYVSFPGSTATQVFPHVITP